MSWLDERVDYSPRGRIPEREAELRLLRAIMTLRVQPDREAAWQRVTSSWPRELQHAAEAVRNLIRRSRSQHITWLQASDYDEFHLENEDPPAKRFEPRPRDLDDMLIALGWFAQLDPPELRANRQLGSCNREQRAIVMRAGDPPLSWHWIGLEFKLSATRVRQIYETAMERVYRVANGRRAFPHTTLPDPMAALRDRNRAARSGS